MQNIHSHNNPAWLQVYARDKIIFKGENGYGNQKFKGYQWGF